MKTRTLGCTTSDPDSGQNLYLAEKNPLLDRDESGRVTATTKMFGLVKTDAQDPNQFATAGFAKLLADELGGYVVELATIGNRPVQDFGASKFSVPQRLVAHGPENSLTVFNPGPVARAMGIDWRNWDDRSGEIADIMGVGYHPGLGEAIFDAAVAAGLIA